MSVDDSLSVVIQNHLIAFIISSFQSLDSGIVRKECAPLVSISIWHHLASAQARESKLEGHTALRKAWRASSKRYDAGDKITRARLEFERSWLYTMILKFVRHIYGSESSLGWCTFRSEPLSSTHISDRHTEILRAVSRTAY